MRGIMVQGTSSDVGKSFIATGLCHLFALEGIKVTPFKSQNVTNDTYVTNDGKEIARSQGIQAEAAGIEANVFMNPILLKPRVNLASELYVYGEKWTVVSGDAYRKEYYDRAIEAITKSLGKLQSMHDVVVIEGAGSPVEMNLHDREIVNMKVAEIANVPVILVADIERGGVFANIVGTLALFSEEERARVKGIIINKFHGDPALFEDGVVWLEEHTGIPILGVIPFIQEKEFDVIDK